jgi:hypothetical protein
VTVDPSRERDLANTLLTAGLDFGGQPRKIV